MAVTLTIAGCGERDESATTTPTTTDGGGLALTEWCMHNENDVRVTVRYPRGWHVNDPPVLPCSAFDPEPFELPAGTEFPRDLAVVLRVERVAFETASEARGLRVEQERRTTIDGRQAVRQEVVTTAEGLGPPGERSTRYAVDAGTGRSIIATHFEVEPNPSIRGMDVLDAMVAALEIEPRAP